MGSTPSQRRHASASGPVTAGTTEAIADRLAGPLRTALVNLAETSQFAEPDHPLVPAELPTSTTVGVGLLDLPDFIGMAHELARRIPGATLVEFAEAAHLLPLEEPARVAALIV